MYVLDKDNYVGDKECFVRYGGRKTGTVEWKVSN